MTKMSKNATMKTFYVEGPDWEQSVQLDVDVFDTHECQVFEAASRAIENEKKTNDDFNLGAILIVKKGKKSAKKIMVNAYICLNNIGKYALAEDLRKNFKKETGQDLADDEPGYSE